MKRREVVGAVAAGLLCPWRLGAARADAADELRIQRLSWAGVKLVYADTTLLLDPWANPAIWDGAWKADVVQPTVDTGGRFVLVSHLHTDHFDAALARSVLGERGSVVCRTSVAAAVAARGLKVRALELYQPLLLGELTAIPVPAVDGRGDDQVSWVVRAGGRNVLHCGDTLWHGNWSVFRGAYGPFDAAFVPINGARFKTAAADVDAPRVMGPQDAVSACLALGAAMGIPIHYGVGSAPDYTEVPDALATFEREGRARGLNVVVLRPGEWLKRPA